MPPLPANTWSPSLCRWRGFTMTADRLRLLQDLRRSLLESARQLRLRIGATRPRQAMPPKPSEPPRFPDEATASPSRRTG